MNYLAHALPFFDKPYFGAATGVPDWLSVIDRKVRLRLKHVEPFLIDADPDPIFASVAGGIAQHLRDDATFHSTRAFFEVSTRLAEIARNILGDEQGLRSHFLGHLLCEILLDATLAEKNENRVTVYYDMLDSIDPMLIESAVNRLAPRQTERLAFFVVEFRQAKILWDYLENDRLMMRLNQVMHRVNLPILPNDFASILPEIRQLVSERTTELLKGTPA